MNGSSALVRYRVRPGQERRNEELVRDVLAELHQAKPAGVRYAVFTELDGRGFVHFAALESDRAREAFTGLAAFARFRADLPARVESTPATVALRPIGSYAFEPGEEVVR